MIFRNAAALFAISSLSGNVLGEVITITRYPSTCSAIYTTGTRSVTIVQSTVTVVPIQYNDEAWNSGTPFVLEIQLDGMYNNLQRREPPQLSWLTLNGNTSTNPLSAGQYQIRNGQLMSVNGSYVSTNLFIENQPFAISPTIGTISTTFSFKDDVLNWTSPRFTNGQAQFYKLPVGLIDNAQVLCKFIGPDEPEQSWAPIVLRARLCDGVHPLSSTTATSTGSITVSSSIVMDSMSSSPPGQYTTEGPPPYTYPQASSSSQSPVPSVSTPPPPYISESASTSYVLPWPSTTSSVTRSSSPSLSSLSTPTTSSDVVPPIYSPPIYTQASSSSVSSSAGPPIYGSETPSSSESSSVSFSDTLSFASSGSPIGPINPPYQPTTSDSSSSSSSSFESSSMSMSSSSMMSSSESSSPTLPPVYTTMSSSSAPSTSPPSSSYSSSSSVASSTSSSTMSSEAEPPTYPDESTTSSSSPSSTIMSTSSSISEPPQYPDESTTSTTTTSSSSEVVPPFYTSSPPPCPEGNNTVYVNTAGNAYTIYCNLDSNPPSYAPPQLISFTACIQACDFDPECGSVSYIGEETCYFKPTPIEYVPGIATLAVRLAGPPTYPDVSSSSTESSSETMSTSSEVPDPYESETMSMTTSSSEMMITSTTESSSSSTEVPDPYEETTTTTSSSSIEAPDPYEETTSTTTTSSSSSSTAASTTTGNAPYSGYLRLASPTPCDFGGPTDTLEDDSYCELELPFDVTLYSTSSNRIFPGTNGHISLERGSTQFLAKRFPYPGTVFPDAVIAPFFDDLFAYGNETTQQWIFYEIEGTKVTFEYYVARAAQRESIYHFTVAYNSAAPNAFTFTYYSVGTMGQADTGMNGAVAFVGIQGLDGQGQKQAAEYSWRQTIVEPGLTVVCNGALNSCIGALP